jgi:hypothetical protein
MKSPASRLVSSIRSTPAHRRRIEKKRLQRRKLAPPRDSALEGGFAALSHANGTGGVNHRRIFRRLPFSYWGVPPLPRSFGIIGLGGKSRQVFGFKGVIGKVFRNKDLGCQRALKMGLEQLRGPSWETGTLPTAPIRSPLSRTAGWMSVTHGPDVSDEKGEGKNREPKARTTSRGHRGTGDTGRGATRRRNCGRGGG